VFSHIKKSLVLPILALAATFTALSLTGLMLMPVNTSDIIVLRGSGLAMAALLLYGPRLWPGVFLGAVMSRGLTMWLGYWDIATLADLLGAFALTAAMTAQAMVGAYVIRRLCGVPLRLQGWRHLGFVLFVALPLTCLIVSTVGIATYLISHDASYRDLAFHWYVWWIGDWIAVGLAVGTVILGPWNRAPAAYWRGVALPQFNTQALIYVVIALSATFSTWMYVSRLGYDSNEAKFMTHVHDNAQALEHRFSVIKLAVDGGGGLFRASERVTARDWRNYVETLELSEDTFGIRSMGFIEPVNPDEVDAFLARAREDGVEGLTIKPEVTNAPMFVVKYIEPLPRNRRALGLNIAFEPGRLQAGIHARDTGETNISEPINLMSGGDAGRAFLMLTPVYREGRSLQTVLERREAFLGWVYSAFTAQNALSTLPQHSGEDLRIALYDGPAVTPEAQFYANYAGAPRAERDVQFRLVEQFEVYGRTWTVVWESAPAFEERLWSIKPVALLFGGMAFSVLLAMFLISLARREELVRSIVVQRTRELATLVDENRSIIETAVAKIALLDGDGNLIRFNDAFVRLLRSDPKEMIGKPLSDVIDGQIAEYFNQPENDDEMSPYRGELSTTSGSGHALILDVQIIPWKNIDGERRFTAVMRDTSRYHLAADQLRNTQRRLELALTAAKIGVFDIDLRTGASVASRTWRELLGLSPDEDIDPQLSWLQRVHPEDLPRIEAADLDCIEGRAARSVSEYRVRVKDSSWRWMRSDMTGEDRDASGRAWRMIGLMSDITDRRHVDDLKKQFVATVSHELRTPLTSINGSISLLLHAMSGGISDDAKRMLTIAQNNCDRLIALVNDILDLEKLETGIIKPTLAQADISAQVERAIQVNQPFGARFDVTYQLTPESEEARGICVLIEENRFQQVMSNLMSNAAKFAPKGSVVTLSIERLGAQVAVSVTDCGRGIPSEFHDRIFKPFSQVDGTSSRAAEGSGLGLHIAKRVIEQMDGSIGFDSVEGESTTFWVMLPIRSDAKAAAREPRTLTSISKLSSRQPHILHVDADHRVAGRLAAAFAPAALVEHVDNDAAARALLATERFSLIILGGDVEDGGESVGGRALLNDITEQQGGDSAGVPIVALTSAAGGQNDRRLRVVFAKSRAQLDDVARRCLAMITENGQ
jgi:PAS domain S-box-containing protein